MSPKKFSLEEIYSKEQNKAIPFIEIKDQVEVGVLTITPNRRLPETGFSVHEKSHEFAIVLEGEISFYTDSEKIIVEKGEFLYNPPGTPHYVINESKKEARILWFVAPPL